MSGVTVPVLVAAIVLSTCSPTPQGGTPSSECQFTAQQASQGLQMDCSVTGQLPNTLIDPLNGLNTSCSLASVSLFNQTVNVPIAVIYGENGDDNSERVRLGATLTSGTHSAKLAKAAGNSCELTTGPNVDVNTAFNGRHVAIVDKSRTPACVFQSRLDLLTFNQTLGAEFSVDVSAVSRAQIRSQLARQLDLELATAVNRLLQPGANVTAPAFVNRAGRCVNDYEEFTGD